MNSNYTILNINHSLSLSFLLRIEFKIARELFWVSHSRLPEGQVLDLALP